MFHAHIFYVRAIMSIILEPILGTENYLTEKTFCFMKKRGVGFFLEEDVNVIYIFVNGGAMWIARLDVRWCSFVLVQNMVVPLSWHDKLEVNLSSKKNWNLRNSLSLNLFGKNEPLPWSPCSGLHSFTNEATWHFHGKKISQPIWKNFLGKFRSYWNWEREGGYGTDKIVWVI